MKRRSVFLHVLTAAVLLWPFHLPAPLVYIPGEGWTKAVTNAGTTLQIPVTNGVSTSPLIDFKPPSGMVLIPAGGFTMGDTFGEGHPDELPLHTNYISAYYMDTNLVSYSQWQGVYHWATNHGYSFDRPGSGKAANHPVHTIYWYDAVKWCNARSEQAGLVPAYYTSAEQTAVYRSGKLNVQTSWVNWNSGYRLPTEAEWEKAARGGLSGKRFPWGDTISASQANYWGDTNISYDLGPNGDNATYATGGYPYTSPVGSFAANGYGLYDMAGNVCEWCWDWYGTYVEGSDPRGLASGPGRVLRGGRWGGSPYITRCAVRFHELPFIGIQYFGFRCVMGQ